MTRTRLLLAAVLAAVLLTTPACTTPWDPDTTAAAIATVDRLEADGTLTPEQATGARQAIEDAADGFSWEDALRLLGEVVGAGVLAFLGVNRVRGPRKPMPKAEADALRIMARRHIDQSGG
jgi:hypothetical protein